jgi:hypothetical protein
MVCCAVSARISPECIEKVNFVRLVPRIANAINLGTITDLIQNAVINLSGVVVAEQGDLYNVDAWRISSILGREVKYPESLGERATVEMAHHISLAGRKLLTSENEDYVYV